MQNGWYEENGCLNHYVNDKYHNDKCTAVIIDKENKFWYQNYKWHRIDGPAWEHSNGEKYWYYQDKHIKCYSQKEFERYLKLKLLW